MLFRKLMLDVILLAALLFEWCPGKNISAGLLAAIRIRQFASAPTDGGFRPDGQSHILRGNPSNYLAQLRRLKPGDTLLLDPGIYDNPETPGLPILGLNGEPQRPIVISGPESGPRPVFFARATHNTVRIADSSYVVIRNLELDGRRLPVDGVKAQGTSHHITIENFCIRNHGNNQQTVGISTKAPAWGWTIRGNVIVGAGTGMYLGDSDGSKPFVQGLIEYNLIQDTLGYNIEIKHENSRPNLLGLPATPAVTIIRHNIFSKAHGGSLGKMTRPNLLVGHFPLSGAGAEDAYEIYGNFFYENTTGEPLFQGEGNFALYNNLFWNDQGDAILVRPHNAYPRRILIFYNTVVARGTGIKVIAGMEAYPQRVVANAVFASLPVLATDQAQNITGTENEARLYLRHPAGPAGQMDLSPLPGKLIGPPLPGQLFKDFDDASLDFNGMQRTGIYRGAYEGSDHNLGQLPRLEIKALAGAPPVRSACSAP